MGPHRGEAAKQRSGRAATLTAKPSQPSRTSLAVPPSQQRDRPHRAACRAQGLQIGLPPVLNFGTEEMKKRVADASESFHSASLKVCRSVAALPSQAPDCLMGSSRPVDCRHEPKRPHPYAAG